MKIITGIYFVFTILFFTSCQEAKVSDGKVRLVYWPSTNPHEIDLGRELVDLWNKTHPDTIVSIQPLPEGRSGEEVLIIAAAGGTGPDICSNIPPVIVPLLAKAKAFIPVDQFPEGRKYISDRLPEKLEETFVANDNKMYQIPWKGNPILVQYNTGLLKELGEEELPETWSQWNRVAKKAAVDLDGDGQLDRWMADLNIISEWRQRLFDFFPFYLAASGGKSLIDNGKVAFNNEAAQRVFDFYAEGFEKGYYAKTIFIGDVFLRGRMLAHITGPWNIAHTERFKTEGFEYAFGPIPVPDDYTGEKFTFGDPKSIAIFSTCEHPEAAWNFVKFITSAQADLRLLEICGQLPLRKNLTTDSLYSSYFHDNPIMVEFAERVPYTIGFDQNTALQEVFDAINEQFDACCINGAVSSQVALERAVKRSQNVLAARGG